MKNVQDMYPLTPMQEAMLLHAVARSGEDVLFSQFQYVLTGNLDVDAFHAAWQRLVDRHAALRTVFVWEQIKRPLQVVRRTATVDFDVLDWRDHPASQQAQCLHELCTRDRRRGFDLTRAPLMRLTLVRLDDTRWHLVWSSHHLVLDRWCLTTLFDELGVLYGANGSLPDAAPGFRDYVAWIAARDDRAARTYWHDVLAVVRHPGRLCELTDRTIPADRATHTIDEAQTASLRDFARRTGSTLSTLLLGSWGLTVNRVTGAPDVLLGVAVSGRPPELAEVEHIVGSFVNNLPQRVALTGNQTTGEWLAGLQLAQHRRVPFEYVSAASMQQWVGLASGEPLFDTLVVWLSPDAPIQLPGLRVEGLPGDMDTAYPLTLSIAESAEDIQIEARTAPGVRTREPLDWLLDTLVQTAQALANLGAQSPLADAPGFRHVAPGEAPPAADQDGTDNAVIVFASSGDVASESQAGREQIDPALIRDLVLAEWEQALGRTDIDPDQDFFDAGGTSLVAASLHAGIEASTRTSVPLLALFKQPTVNRMVDTLQHADWPLKADMVTPIRASGTEPALFCIASPEVNTVGYALLARHLDRRHPVYVIQAPPDSANLRKLTPDELPAVARHYVEVLSAAHPRGSVRLLGMCTGAHLTVEMARQLAQAGRPPAFVGIINTWALYTVSRLYHVQKIINRMAYYGRRVRELLRMEPRQILTTIRRVAARRARTARRAVTPGRRAPPVDAPTPQPVRWIDEVGWAHKDPGREKYRGRVSVFCIRRQPFWRKRDAGLGWGRAALEIHVERLPGDDHDAILRPPHVSALARRIEKRLDGNGTGARTQAPAGESPAAEQPGA